MMGRVTSCFNRTVKQLLGLVCKFLSDRVHAVARQRHDQPRDNVHYLSVHPL